MEKITFELDNLKYLMTFERDRHTQKKVRLYLLPEKKEIKVMPILRKTIERKNYHISLYHIKSKKNTRTLAKEVYEVMK